MADHCRIKTITSHVFTNDVIDGGNELVREAKKALGDVSYSIMEIAMNW